MEAIAAPNKLEGFRLYGWVKGSSSDSKDLMGIYNTYDEAHIAIAAHRKTIHFHIESFEDRSDYIDMDDIDDVAKAVEFILMGKDREYQRRVLSRVMDSFKD